MWNFFAIILFIIFLGTVGIPVLAGLFSAVVYGVMGLLGFAFMCLYYIGIPLLILALAIWVIMCVIKLFTD